MRRIVLGFCLPFLLVTSPAAAQSLRPLSVCVVANGKLQEVTAAYNPATGDTTVNGRAFAAAYPSSAPHYAGWQPWYVDDGVVSYGGAFYAKYGLPRILGVSEVQSRAPYRGVPLFAEPGATTPVEVLYAPVRAGCEFQPYQILTGVVGEIAVGETRTGALAHDEPKEDSHHYESWLLRGRAGDVFEVSLESDDFDAYLEFRGDAVDESLADDDSGGGLDARFQVALPDDGTYQLVVSTADEEEIGAYSLSVTRPAWAASLGTRRVLWWGEHIDGELRSTDPLASGARYQDYLYSAEEEETTTFDLVSEGFDAFLAVGRVDGTRFLPLKEDDDGGSGTDARLEATFPEAGVYVLRVSALGGGTGAYTLAAGAVPVVTLGETVSGELSGTEPEVEEGRFADEYLYQARAGESIVIEAASDEVDVFVFIIVQAVDSQPKVLATDDDGGDGTDSRLEFTFPSAGTYSIGVTSAAKDETGAYTLRVRAK